MKTKSSFLTPLFVLVVYFLMFASRLFGEKLLEGDNNIYLSVFILQILCLIIPTIVFCRSRGTGYFGKLNLKFVSPWKLSCIITSALMLICGSVLIRFCQIYLGGMESFSFSLFDFYLKNTGEQNFLFTATVFVVMPTIAEEFVFRTVVLTEYNENGYGAVTASVISSLLSAMSYFSLEKFPIFFFAGIISCMITYATGSSLTSFLSRLIFCFYGIFAEKYVMRALINPLNKIISIFAFALLFLIFAFITFSELEHILKKTAANGTPTPSYRLKKSEDGMTPDIAATEAEENKEDEKNVIGNKTKMNIEAYFSPTFLFCVLFFAVMIFSFR